MKRSNFRRVFVAVSLPAMIIIYAVSWARMISTPTERTGADFIAFFTAGRIAQMDGAAHVYEPALQQGVQQAEVGFTLVPGQVLLYNHVPYLIPVLAVLINGNYLASFYRWVVLLLMIFSISVVLLGGSLRRAGWDKAEVWLAMAGMLSFFPLFVSLLTGQDTAIIFFGLCLYLAGLLTGRDWLAGFGLALTTVRPHVTVLLAVPFLFRRQKVFGWFCFGAGVLGVLSLVIMDYDGMGGFLHLLQVSAGGEWYGLNESFMVNLVGLLWRVAPRLSGDVIHWIGWVVYGVTLTGLCVLWARSREIGEKQIGLAIVLAVFAAPHLHYHDLTLLIVALLATLVVLVRDGFLEERKAALLPLALSLVLLFSNFTPIFKYNFPYLIMLMLVLVLWIPGTLFCGRKTSQ